MSNKNLTSGPTQGVSVPLYSALNTVADKIRNLGVPSMMENTMPIIIINNGTFSNSISTGSSGSERAPGGNQPWLRSFFAWAVAIGVLVLAFVVVVVVNVTVNGPISIGSNNPVNYIVNGSDNTFIGSISSHGDASLQLGAGK